MAATSGRFLKGASFAARRLRSRDGPAPARRSRTAQAIPTPSPAVPSSTSRSRPAWRRCPSRARFRRARRRRRSPRRPPPPPCRERGTPCRGALSTCAPRRFLLYCAPRGDSFLVVCTAHYSGNRKSLPAFPALPKIYFPLILLALADIWDNLSRIFRDKGEHSTLTPVFSG